MQSVGNCNGRGSVGRRTRRARENGRGPRRAAALIREQASLTIVARITSLAVVVGRGLSTVPVAELSGSAHLSLAREHCIQPFPITQPQRCDKVGWSPLLDGMRRSHLSKFFAGQLYVDVSERNP